MAQVAVVLPNSPLAKVTLQESFLFRYLCNAEIIFRLG